MTNIATVNFVKTGRNKMDLKEFEGKIEEKSSRKGWRIVIELDGIWRFYIYDKKTDALLAETGSSGISPLFIALDMPFDKPPWV